MNCRRCHAMQVERRYPVGAATVDVCGPCWDELTGRPYLDPAYRGRGPSTFAERIAEMRRRRAVIEANGMARREAAQR